MQAFKVQLERDMATQDSEVRMLGARCSVLSARCSVLVPRSAADAWPAYERLRGPNQWPVAAPSLRRALTEYTTAASSVGRELTDALAVALGLPQPSLRELFEPTPHWQLKLASYPPADVGASEEAVGVGAHSTRSTPFEARTLSRTPHSQPIATLPWTCATIHFARVHCVHLLFGSGLGLPDAAAAR